MYSLLGHIKWFAEDTDSSSIASLATKEWLVITGCLIIGVALMWLINRLMAGPSKVLDNKFKNLRPWAPTVVRWSSAALLIANYFQDYLFAPNIDYSQSYSSALISAVLVAVALLLLLGIYTRIAGMVLLVAFVLSIFVVSNPLQLLEHLEYIGIGLFLVFSDTGRLSIINKVPDPLTSLGKFDYLSLTMLRTFTGLALVILAFSEKLLNMNLANDFLVHYENWNFLASFGMDNRNFIIMTGIIELLLGLSLILNKAVRLSTLALLLTMIATALLLGIDEVIGHLFAVGLVFAVWVGPNINFSLKKPSAG